jgi:hypothetical protein
MWIYPALEEEFVVVLVRDDKPLEVLKSSSLGEWEELGAVKADNIKLIRRIEMKIVFETDGIVETSSEGILLFIITHVFLLFRRASSVRANSTHLRPNFVTSCFLIELNDLHHGLRILFLF